MLETTARSVLCLRCTNCLRQYCTADFPRRDQIQAEDQAGFRRTYQAMDHLTTYRMIDQGCHEWGINMWAATIDFMKVFDSITHKSIWDALKSCGIEHEYIHLLRKLYKDLKATVLTDEESDMFEIKRGPNTVTLCQACSSTLFCRRPWKNTFHVVKRKEEWVSAWEKAIMTASQI